MNCFACIPISYFRCSGESNTCDEAHTQRRAAGKSCSEIPRRRSRGLCAGGKCSPAVAERSRQLPTDGSGEQRQRRFTRESARAYKPSCAVHRQFRIARRHIVAFLNTLTLLQLAPNVGLEPTTLRLRVSCPTNWRPKHVGTRTPSTTSMQGNPIRGDRIGTGNPDSV